MENNNCLSIILSQQIVLHRNTIHHSPAESVENIQHEKRADRVVIIREYARGTVMLPKAAQRHYALTLKEQLGKELNDKLKWLEAMQLESRTAY